MPLIRAASTVSTEGSHTATPLRSSTAASSRNSTVSPPRVTTVTATATTGGQSATAVSGALQIQSSNFPVRIVVGSVVGGMAVAIVVVLVWTYLGKSFRRQQQDQARTLWTSKNNKHGPYSQCIHIGKRIRPSEKMQPLTSSNNENEKAGSHHAIRQVSTPNSIVSTPPRLLPPQLVFKPVKISQPRTLRKVTRQNRLIDGKLPLSPITDVDNEVVDALLEEPLGNPFANNSALIVNAPGAVTHKPSVIGSASVYSTESGEERQNLGDPSFALATLGPPGLDTAMARPQSFMSHKLSNVSSIYSSQSGEEREFGVPSNFLTTLGPDRRRLSAHSHGSGPLYFAADEQAVMRGGARNAGEGNAMILSRLSQVSSVSASSRVDG